MINKDNLIRLGRNEVQYAIGNASQEETKAFEKELRKTIDKTSLDSRKALFTFFTLILAWFLIRFAIVNEVSVLGIKIAGGRTTLLILMLGASVSYYLYIANFALAFIASSLLAKLFPTYSSVNLESFAIPLINQDPTIMESTFFNILYPDWGKGNNSPMLPILWLFLMLLIMFFVPLVLMVFTIVILILDLFSNPTLWGLSILFILITLLTIFRSFSLLIKVYPFFSSDSVK